MGDAAAPRVNIVLLNWNGWRDTIECLETAFRLDYRDFRVIVCDNASTDDSLEHIAWWARGELEANLPAGELRHLAPGPLPKPVTCARLGRADAERGGLPDRSDRDASLVLIDAEENRGFAAGNNVALRYLRAAGEQGYVWLLNNDTVVAPDALRLMVDRLERETDAGCMGALLLEYDHPDRIDAAGGGRVHAWQGLPRETTATGQARGTAAAVPRRLDFITGGSLLMPLATVDAVGLMDERFFLYCEDIDYSLRIRASGKRIAYEPDALIWHKGGSTVGHRSTRHDYHLVRSALMLVRKSNPALLPVAMVYCGYRCVLPKVVRREWPRITAVARAYRDALRPVPPLRGRYLVRSPLWRAALASCDAVLDRTIGRARSSDIPRPRRMLLAVGGHLGDAVIATSVLPLLARRFPDVELGMLVPSWSAHVVRGHPLLRHLHTVDHWKTNRGDGGTVARLAQWRRTARVAASELRRVQYDTAIDLYPFYENAAYLLWRTGIPVRIGYRSGGLGALYTHSLDWNVERQSVVEGHLALLGVLDPDLANEDPSAVTYDLPMIPPAAKARADSVRAAAGAPEDGYVVLHPGTGAETKRWPVDRWNEVARRLASRGDCVVLTGSGTDEQSLARRIAAGSEGIVDLCDRLDWDAFRATIAAARLVVGVDSVAMHIAAAHNRPSVTIMAGADDRIAWQPLGRRVVTLPGDAVVDDVVGAVTLLNSSCESPAAC